MHLTPNPFGEGAALILLDDVNCRGNETSLADCQHAEWGEHNCGHDEDVAIKCVNNDLAITGHLNNSNNSHFGQGFGSDIQRITTQRRSVAKSVGYFQRRLFVRVFVCLSTR